MKSFTSGKTFLVFVLLVIVSSPLFGDNLRFRYMGSSCLSYPTGYTGSESAYIVDDTHQMALICQPFLGSFLEFSYLKHLNDAQSGKGIINLKVNILEEDQYLPNIVWGLSDFQKKLGSRIFYFAGSKTIESFGLTVHVGTYKDPITTNREFYCGAEKTILPLVAVAAEYADGKNTIGFKLRPYPGVSIEYGRRATGSDDEKSIYKLLYMKSF